MDESRQRSSSNLLTEYDDVAPLTRHPGDRITAKSILRPVVLFLLLLMYFLFEFPQYLAGNAKYLGMLLLSVLLMLCIAYLCFEPFWIRLVGRLSRDRESIGKRVAVLLMIGLASLTHFNQALLNHGLYFQARIISLPLDRANILVWCILTILALALMIRVPHTYAPIIGLALIWGGILCLLAYYKVPFDRHAADMIYCIDESARLLLHGINPYGQTFSSDPSNAYPLVYTPLLWLPYVPFKALSLDLRWFNLLAQFSLYVFLWSLIGRRTRDFSRTIILLFLILMPDMVFSFFYREVPHYWLLGAVYLWLVWRERWNLSLLAVSGLVAMRFDALTVLWIYLFYLWKRRGLRIAVVHGAIAGAIFVAFLVPFLSVGLGRLKAVMFDFFTAKLAAQGWEQPLSGLSIGGILKLAGFTRLIMPLQVGGLLLIGIIYHLAGDDSYRTFARLTVFAYAYFLWLSGIMYIYYWFFPVVLLATLFFLPLHERKAADLSVPGGALVGSPASGEYAS